MIPQTSAPRQTATWREALMRSVRTADELCRLLELDPAALDLGEQAARSFPVRVPLEFVRRMQRGDPNDPLLRQVLNLGAEELPVAGFVNDPVGERDANPVPGLIHKYRGRVLMIISGSCAVHCRYCFRRHFPYAENNPGRRDWRHALDYIAADRSITEIIFSGGDPLSAPDEHLQWLVEQLRAIDHVRWLRVHTRLPVVIPQRIDDACLAWLADGGLRSTLVLHINHHAEIDDEVASMCARLRGAGITLLNQSVLLRGVNDDARLLAELSCRLHEIGVLPYYVHLLDPVAGAAHFDVPAAEALRIQLQLRALLPGFLTPRFVKEIAGQQAKTPIEFASAD